MAIPNRQFFFVKTTNAICRIDFEDVLYIQGLENYVRIHTTSEKFVAPATMKILETILSQYHFLRIHKSYIVNLAKIDSVANYTIKIDNETINIGRNYRKLVFDTLRNYSIDFL